MKTPTNTEIVESPHELEVLATKILDGIKLANSKSEEALKSGAEVGCLLQKAEANCQTSGESYNKWIQERLNLNRETVKKWSSLYVNWPQIAEALESQTCFDFGVAKRLTKQPNKTAMTGALCKPFKDFPDSVFEIPETVCEQFNYPEEESAEQPDHSPAEALRAVLKMVVPPRINTIEQAKTFQLQAIGLFFALNSMPDGCSMRQVSDWLLISHGAISKFVRNFSDATGVRSPIQKKESTRATYSKTQKENHWRKKKNAHGEELGEDGLPK